jgi:hypothetical protein
VIRIDRGVNGHLPLLLLLCKRDGLMVPIDGSRVLLVVATRFIAFCRMWVNVKRSSSEAT